MSDELINLVLNEVRAQGAAVGDFGRKIGSFDERFSDLGARLAGLDERIVGVFEKLDARIGSLEARIGSLEARIGSLDARIDSLDARIGSLEVRIGSLEVRITSLEAKVVSLEGSSLALSIELSSVRGDVMARIDRLQENLEGVREDLIVNLGQAQRAERIALGIREETRNEQKEFRLLAEQVNAMQRSILRINTRLDLLGKDAS